MTPLIRKLSQGLVPLLFTLAFGCDTDDDDSNDVDPVAMSDSTSSSTTNETTGETSSSTDTTTSEATTSGSAGSQGGSSGDESVVDACLNEADAIVLDEIDEEAAANGCGMMNIGNVDAAVECLVSTTGLSNACANCFGITIGCVFQQCIPACLDGASPECVECRTTNCDPPFLMCAGFDSE